MVTRAGPTASGGRRFRLIRGDDDERGASR
jgi:hypothetical protein